VPIVETKQYIIGTSGVVVRLRR